MIQSYHRRLFITGILSTLHYSGFAQQSMLMPLPPPTVFDAKVDLKESKGIKPTKHATAIVNRVAYISINETTGKPDHSMPSIKLTFKVFSTPKNHKNENKRLKLEGKISFSKKTNLYTFIPKLEYYPVKKVGVYLKVLLGSPDVFPFRINQLKKMYLIKLSLKF